jgi:hypothetical protein
MDTNKAFFYVFLTKKDMYSKRKFNLLHWPITRLFLKHPLSIMNMTIFNFQNMMDMHNGYAYQIFNSIVYGEKITLSIAYPPRTKPTWTNPKQTNLLGNWTPILWRTLPNCNTSSLPQPHPTQTHPSPTKLITINLQFFKRIMFIN